MFTDQNGKTWYKVNLHTHTTRSHGHVSPKEAARIYRDAGYDAIALTDHWVWTEDIPDSEGIFVMGGAEYDAGFRDGRAGVYHILGLGMSEPLVHGRGADALTLIREIRERGGYPILAHPAWSLNRPSQVKPLVEAGVIATEVWNSVSAIGMSNRPDSSLLIDLYACEGIFLPLLAVDDTHYFIDDCAVGATYVQADALNSRAICEAIRDGRTLATEGPIASIRREGEDIILETTPVDDAVFCSNIVWKPGRRQTADGGTRFVYHPSPEDGEFYVRAEVTDRQGRRAWTNCLVL